MEHESIDSPDDRNKRNLPSLLIPYWDPGTLSSSDPGDRGDVRPLPAGVISYLCEGIATSGPYQPGQPLTVTVAVRNWGGGSTTSIAMVRLWWEYPGTSFVAMNPARLMGVASVVVPPRGATSQTVAMTHVFKTLPPAHICLIACVDHALDQAPRTSNGSLIPLPGTERHWAQHNLSYVTPGANGLIDFTFVASNPFQREAEFIFEVRPFASARLARLQRSVRSDVVHAEARCEIHSARDLQRGEAPSRGERAYPLTLDAGRQTAMHLRMQLGNTLRPGQIAAFELLQRREGDDRAMGGIALAVVGQDRQR